MFVFNLTITKKPVNIKIPVAAIYTTSMIIWTRELGLTYLELAVLLLFSYLHFTTTESGLSWALL